MAWQVSGIIREQNRAGKNDTGRVQEEPSAMEQRRLHGGQRTKRQREAEKKKTSQEGAERKGETARDTDTETDRKRQP